MTVANKNCIQEEMKSILNSNNALCQILGRSNKVEGDTTETLLSMHRKF